MNATNLAQPCPARRSRCRRWERAAARRSAPDLDRPRRVVPARPAAESANGRGVTSPHGRQQGRIETLARGRGGLRDGAAAPRRAERARSVGRRNDQKSNDSKATKRVRPGSSSSSAFASFKPARLFLWLYALLSRRVSTPSPTSDPMWVSSGSSTRQARVWNLDLDLLTSTAASSLVK